MAASSENNPPLIRQLLDALDALSGLHPGFRPTHAKGLMCAGTFSPSPEAAQLTRAPARGQADHPGHRALLGLHGRADDPRQRPGAIRTTGDRRPLPSWPTMSTRTSSPIPPTVSPSAPARSSWSSSAPRPPSGRASPRRSAAFLATHPNAKRFVEDAQADPDQLRTGGVLRRHVLRVHQRRGRQPPRALPHPARRRDRIPLGRRSRREVRRTSSSRRSASGWRRGQPGSASSCSWRGTATT